MLIKFPFRSQHYLLENLSVCYHFPEPILEAANLCGILTGVCFAMSRRYFLYTNLIYLILNFEMTSHAFVLLGIY